MNVEGRICLEGLLVFGLGSLAVVYYVAPKLNEYLKKFPIRKLTFVAALLISLFTFDVFYSSFHPNTGEGITETVCYNKN